MALVFSATPFLNRGEFSQDDSANRTHIRIVRVTGFVASTYYPMIIELYADAGVPVIGTKVPDADASFSQLRLRRWRIAEVVCNPSAPEMHLEEEYASYTNTTIISTVPDKDGPVVFRQRTITREVQTSLDRNGDLIQTQWNGEFQTKIVSRPRSLMVYECERLEESNPEPRVRDLLDTVNDFSWNGRPARSVLFESYFADTRDEGETYQVVYSFVHDPDGWDDVYPHIWPIGIPPPNLPTTPAPATGLIQPEVLFEGDFSVLNISIPT